MKKAAVQKKTKKNSQTISFVVVRKEKKKKSIQITKAAWFCMETTVAGCLVLMEAT